MYYRPHPIADIFPLITGEEFVALKQDIRENGLREAIWLYEGMILDGRNRFRACQEVGVEPAFRAYEGDSPATFAVSLNLHRRHLDKSQAATVGVELLPHLEREAKARQRAAGGDRGNQYTGGKVAVGQKIDQAAPESTAPETPRRADRALDLAAKLTGTNRQYVADAKKLKEQNPEVFEQVKAGEKTIVQARRELKEERRERQRQENREKIVAAGSTAVLETLQVQFPTILIDPPWDWGDEGDQDQLGRARPDYSTMSFEQLLELNVADLSMPDAHLYLWITNRSLPKGFALLERWGFRYVTCLTWVKPHFGMGNYFRGQTEQVLFGVRGSLMLKRRDVGTAFHAPRGPNGHSSKPLEFYDLVESCSPGPYLEMFSRSARQDWTTWGQQGLASNAA
jgi:N6-adenosine-specific RNA methylase IME4